MKQIIIADLKTNNENSLFRKLSPAEIETVSGGSVKNYYITSNTGDVDINKPPTFPSGGGGGDKFSSNKINTIDYSRSTYILINSW